MKNHIALKFIAILLCALTLLTAILSVVGIAVLSSQELYEQDPQELYREDQQAIYNRVAREIARNYASQTLGGCDQALIDAYYGNPNWADTYLKDGYYFYTILDADGNILVSNYEKQAVADTYSLTITGGSYLRQILVTESKFGDDYMGEALMEPTNPDNPESYDTVHIYVEKLGIYLAYQYGHEDMPELTVNLYLLEGARTDTESYQWAQLLWENRFNLFWVLGISLLVFAIGAVYLCCAAGKSPGSDEVKPGGFNALPLDLYLGLVWLVAFVSVQMVQEIGYYWSTRTVPAAAALLFLAFFDCLVFVAFCFACAAQFRQGGGRWWRKSAIGWTAIELIAFAKEAVSVHIPAGARALWRFIKRAARGMKKLLVFLFTESYAVLKWFFSGLWRLCKKLARFLGAAASAAWIQVKKGWSWLWRKILRFSCLLPLTWQWLLVGFVMIFLLVLTVSNGYWRPEILLLGVGACVVVILYGAHAFGILLEATRRMAQGDLESKVSDRLLLGSFYTFAQELNALAGVAKVAAQREMKSERMKTELITNVSHDIKTPLTSIINYVDLLQKPHTLEEEQQYLEVLGRKSEQLKKLIQDLMEMSKASTGNMAVDIQTVDAVETINQALGEFSDKLAGSALTPVFTAPAESVAIRADGRLVWRVLNNLLSNAVKYAMPGTRLYIDLARRGDKVAISLKNISAQALNVDAEELMERFVRGDAARNTDGSGLGLNIAKSLMEVQQGRLELTVDGDLFKATMVFPGA